MEDAIKSWESNTKEVYHDATIIDKRLGRDIPSISEVTKNSCDPLDSHKAIFYCDIFVAILLFSSFKMSEFAKILRMKFVCEDLCNLCLEKARISIGNQECEGGYLTYRFLFIHSVSGGRCINYPCLNSCNTRTAFGNSTCFGGSYVYFKFLLLHRKSYVQLLACISKVRCNLKLCQMRTWLHWDF